MDLSVKPTFSTNDEALIRELVLNKKDEKYPLSGVHDFFCPFCMQTTKTVAVDENINVNICEYYMCIDCNQIMRRRVAYLALIQEILKPSVKKVFLPSEFWLEKYIREYITQNSLDKELIISTDIDICQKTKFRDGEFDLFACFDVLEHAYSYKGALNEIKRITRRGGTILLSFPIDSKNRTEHYRLAENKGGKIEWIYPFTPTYHGSDIKHPVYWYFFSPIVQEIKDIFGSCQFEKYQEPKFGIYGSGFNVLRCTKFT